MSRIPIASFRAPAAPQTIDLTGVAVVFRRTGSDLTFPSRTDMQVLLGVCSGGVIFLDLDETDAAAVGAARNASVQPL